MKTVRTFSIVLSLLVAPAIAMAHPDEDGPRRGDRNRRAELLARFDANHDGKLDDAERAAMHEQRVNDHFDRLDANRDGMVSRAEFVAGAKARWQARDARHFRHRKAGAPHHRSGEGPASDK